MLLMYGLILSHDRYVEGGAPVAEPELRVLGGYNVFVRYPTACRTSGVVRYF